MIRPLSPAFLPIVCPIALVATNQTQRKITGVLDTDLPPGLTLRIAFTPPDGGGSAGAIPLSTASQDFVTGLRLRPLGRPRRHVYTLSDHS